MKKSYYYITLLLFGIMLVTSCQKEAREFIDETEEEETFTATANLANLLVRTAQNFGGIDDIIDGSDCFSLQLPVTVIANGQEVIVTSEDDYDAVAAILNQFPDDIDTVELVFPVTVIFNDFTEIVVNNQDEFDGITELCDESGILASIGCVDIVYPVTFFRYNAANEQTDTVVIESDTQLYQFLTQLSEDEFISINYPLSLVVNGETVTVTSNQELETQLEAADCTTIANIDETDFSNTLTGAPWYVSYYFDDLDMTSTFNDYEFTFASDNTAQAATSSGITDGTWQFFLDSDIGYLDLFFGSSTPLNLIDED